jgi:hydroxypyruvate isomerase
MRPFSANISTLFADAPLLQRFARARAAGFDSVEIQFPYEVPLDDLVAAQRAAGVAVDLVNLPAGDFSTGVRGIAGLPEPRFAAEFKAGLERGRRYAEVLGARKVNVLAGIRGADAALPRADYLAALAGNLRAAAHAFVGSGITVLLEAINDTTVPGFLVNTTAQALALVRAADPRIKVQADLFHMNMMGEDVPAALLALGDRLGHVQFADVPGRGEPGSGRLDWRRQFAAVAAAGYAGPLAAEYTPTRLTEDTLAWRTEFA